MKLRLPHWPRRRAEGGAIPPYRPDDDTVMVDLSPGTVEGAITAHVDREVLDRLNETPRSRA